MNDRMTTRSHEPIGDDSVRQGIDDAESPIRWFNEISIDDVPLVGGKNASLGEMYQRLSEAGVRVPYGFATTADAFRRFLTANDLDRQIAAELTPWDGADVDDLAVRARRIRGLIRAAELGPELTNEIVAAYHRLSSDSGTEQIEVAVRSSATAEDLPEASFAGQQESFLMVVGAAAVVEAVQACFASLYNARAISYRRHMGIDETDIALSAGIQRMVRADQAASGVIFTLDPDSGHAGVVSITSAWGLGENIVQGRVVPDTFVVHKDRLVAGFAPLVGKTVGAKELRMTYDEHSGRIRNERTPDGDRERFSLSDDDVLQLARWAISIEDYYSAGRGTETPMDIEWAKDGRTGELFVVQARPETVHSRRDSTAVMEVHRLRESGRVLGSGLAVGDRIASGVTRSAVDPSDMGSINPGDVLVAETTDPDWEPIMKRASALVTERGGRTSHAAIVARELGIPAIVGLSDARALLGTGTEVTVSCAEGSVGHVYSGLLRHDVERIEVGQLPSTTTDIMVNLGDPSLAYNTAVLPSAGIGLARMEFIFASHVGIHPLALLQPEMLPVRTRSDILQRTVGYDRPADFLIERVALGVGTLAAAFWPRPVILRFSDFKTNEYAGLLGGEMFEPSEENPMMGWRGASRYHHPDYRAGFELELAAVRRVRSTFGLTNLKVMVPFCRTPEEGRNVVEVMAENGLVQGEDGFEIYVMTEIPANVLQADEFAEVFDGFSIGSNDLTQLTLGVDRDSEMISDLFDERNPAVQRSCAMAIAAAKAANRRIGICGQAPSDFPDFAAFLVGQGIDSISVTPDALVGTIGVVAEAERELADRADDPAPESEPNMRKASE